MVQSRSISRQSVSRRFVLKGAAASMMVPAFAGAGVLSSAKFASAQDASDFRMEYTNFPTLDPQFVTNGMWFAAEGLFEGVTRLANGGVDAVGAAAES